VIEWGVGSEGEGVREEDRVENTHRILVQNLRCWKIVNGQR